MLHLVYGGSGSGKSAYAESLVEQYAGEKRYYLATMQVFGKEDEERVQRHRTMRQEKNFLTIEKPLDVGEVSAEPEATLLLECMSNLVANEMFREPASCKSAREVTDKILADIDRLAETVENLVIVSANVFDDGLSYSEETTRYIRALADINDGLAKRADFVTEVLVGIPLVLKEEGREVKACAKS